LPSCDGDASLLLALCGHQTSTLTQAVRER